MVAALRPTFPLTPKGVRFVDVYSSASPAHRNLARILTDQSFKCKTEIHTDITPCCLCRDPNRTDFQRTLRGLTATRLDTPSTVVQRGLSCSRYLDLLRLPLLDCRVYVPDGDIVHLGDTRSALSRQMPFDKSAVQGVLEHGVVFLFGSLLTREDRYPKTAPNTTDFRFETATRVELVFARFAVWCLAYLATPS